MRVKSPTMIGIALSTAALLVATACGSSSSNSDDNGASGQNSSSNSTNDNESQSDKPSVTLTISTGYNEDYSQGKALRALTDEYTEEHPEVEFYYEPGIGGGNQIQKLQAESTSNSLPDIAIVDNSNYPVVASFAKPQNLTSVVDSIGKDKYLKGALDITTDPDSGDIGGLFLGNNTLAILYDKDAFEDAGIAELPETWDEFLDVAEKLKSAGYLPFQFGMASGGTAMWQASPWHWTAGGSDTDLSDAGNVKTLTFFRTLVDKGYVSSDTATQTQDDGMNMFANHKVAMIENGPWAFPTLDEADDLNYDSFPIPVPDAGDDLVAVLGGEVMVAPTTGDQDREDATVDFIEWMQDADRLITLNTALGYIPTRTDLWDTYREANPEMGPFIDSLPAARGRSTVLGVDTPLLQEQFELAIQKVLLGDSTPEEALSEAQTALAEALDN